MAIRGRTCGLCQKDAAIQAPERKWGKEDGVAAGGRYEMQVDVMKRLLATYYYITIKSHMDVTPDTSLILTNDTSAG